MSDLSNLLGDVYGLNDPDGPPVRHEAPAASRVPEFDLPSTHRDDDLTSALSAALAEASSPAAPAAPVPAYEPPAAPAYEPAPAMDEPKAAWTTAAEPAPPAPTYEPPSASFTPQVRTWSFGDDDIVAAPKR